MAVYMGVYYKAPDDPDAFEKRYLTEHLPMVQDYDKIKNTSFFKVGKKVMGEFPYSYVFVGTWEDRDGFKADLGSPKAAAATENAKEIAPPFDVVVFEKLA